MIWMLLVLFYGVSKGAREVVKKKAMEKSSVMEVLLFYTLVAFIMVIPQAPMAGGLAPRFYGWIALKSFIIFVAWICSFKAIKKMPISLYGILDLSRVLFATLLGVFILHETLNINQITGLVFVSAGLLMLKYKPKFLLNISSKANEDADVSTDAMQTSKPVSEDTDATKLVSNDTLTSKTVTDKTQTKNTDADSIQTSQTLQASQPETTAIYVIAAFASCILNAVSGTMDKILMKDISSAQLQFWYMLFLLAYYIIYILITKTKIRAAAFKNGWIWLLALLFVLADKALFVANGYPESKVIIMTLLKQSCCVITILAGKFIFKEKNVGYKFICAGVVVAGILIAVL